MTTTIDLEPIIRSHRFPEYTATLLERLQQERDRREQFYDDIDESQKAEFSNGEVIMHSPARRKHSIVQMQLGRMLSLFVDRHQLGEVFQDKTLCVFPRNDYEPDIVFFGQQKVAHFTDGMMKFPIPDLVVEILSESIEHHDRGVKFEDFEAHGVGEYWIVDADTETVEQYVIENGQFQLRLKSRTGDIQSAVVTGFRVPIRAVFDRAANIAAMDDIAHQQRR